MSEELELELVRLVGSEIDDQAISEIAQLLERRLAYPPEMTVLLRLVAGGPLFVARRPCGASPEIVGAAGLAPHGEGGLVEVVAVDPDLAGPLVEMALRARLRSAAPDRSLFRYRDRPPLGLTAYGVG